MPAAKGLGRGEGGAVGGAQGERWRLAETEETKGCKEGEVRVRVHSMLSVTEITGAGAPLRKTRSLASTRVFLLTGSLEGSQAPWGSPPPSPLSHSARYSVAQGTNHETIPPVRRLRHTQTSQRTSKSPPSPLFLFFWGGQGEFGRVHRGTIAASPSLRVRVCPALRSPLPLLFARPPYRVRS